MEYDAILTSVGEFGKYQRKIVLILCLINLPVAFQNLGYMFWGSRPDHWCDVTKPDSLRDISDDIWKNLTIPSDFNEQSQVQYSQCERYDINMTSVSTVEDVEELLARRQYSVGTNATVQCSKWQYDTSEFESTIVSQVHW